MEPASPVGTLRNACESTAAILENVSSGQLTLATPCTDWRVGDLIDHIVGAADFFAAVAELGASPAGREWPGYADGDFATAFSKHADRLLTAFSAPGTMDRAMTLPTGPAPGSWCIAVATGEIFVHGWDLARATGQGLPPAGDGVADWLLSSHWPDLCAVVRTADSAVLAPALEVPAGASAVARLAAFLGRDPGWPSG